MKKLGLWLMSICLIICSSFAAAGCNIFDKISNDKEESSAEVQEYVELSDTAISLEVYMEYTLTVTTNVNKDVVWTTSDASVATVEDGVISANSEGVATITATAGSISATCAVTVTHLSGFPDLRLSNKTLALVEGGESITIDASVFYKGQQQECSFIWETANPSIATVENGKVTPVGTGETTISVTTVCLGEILTEEIQVFVSVDEQILISKGVLELTLTQINATDLTSDAFVAEAYVKGVVNSDAALTFVSSNGDVATVVANGNKATVTAVGLGSCEIIVSYESENGKIQSSVEVNVSRAEVFIATISEIVYAGAETKLDLSNFDLVGEFQGVYYANECVSSLDGTLTKDFADANNHGFAVAVELRTDVAVYYAQIAISIEYTETSILLGETSKALNAYEGDVTAIGFAEGDSVYTYTVTENDAAWVNRMISKDSGKILSFDHWIVEFSLGQEPTGSANSGFIMSAWVGSTHFVLVSGDRMGVHIFDPEGTDEYEGSDADHAANPCLSIYDAEGKIPARIRANQKYYLEMHIEHAGKGDNFSFAFNDALDVYIGNSFFCTDSYYDVNIAPTRDNTIPEPESPTAKYPVVQGESREEMPKFEGDVTTLGFEEGTVVYELENHSTENIWDDAWYQRTIIFTDMKHGYVSFEFVMGADVSMGSLFSVWGVSGAPHIGQVSCAGVTADWAVVTDMDGKTVTGGIQKDTHYVLYLACEGLSEIQVGSLVNGTTYFANISFGDEFGGSNPDEPIVPTTPAVSQGDDRREMPTYEGEATVLGFLSGTETVYVIDTDAQKGWDNRIVMQVEEDKDYVKFDVIFSADISYFNIWPANDKGTQGVYKVTPTESSTSDAIQDRKIVVVDRYGNEATSFAKGELYTVYFYLIEETNIQMNTFLTATVYVANIECGNGEIPGGSTPDTPDTPDDPDQPFTPSITQGEKRGTMPTYGGDETALGFAEGTVVYQIDGPQSNATDVKLVASVDATKAYAKMDIVFSAKTSSFGLWITAATTHLGYYTVAPTAFTPDALGDPSRDIFVTDENGDKVTSFDANKIYTLYIGLDGREATIQVTTWASLTMYVANVAYITEAEAPVEPAPPVVDGKSISILFIGNSFSDDTEAYIVDILLNLGYTDINVGNLYIGGCSIDTHYSNIMNNASEYEFRMRTHNGKQYTEYETTSVDGKKQSIAFAIAYKNWDIISVQQASGESGKADTYKNLEALVSEVKKQATNADVEIVFNMTWAYQGDSTHPQFSDYNNDQMTMYNAIVDAVQTQVQYTVVPNGTAIQNARTSSLGDTLTRDGFHLDLKVGRFIAGLTFVAKVTGEDITKLAYAPGGLNDLQIAIAMESVQNALKNPFAVTQSEVNEEAIENPAIIAGGSNATAISLYRGDETVLGFAEGTTVYQFVCVDTSEDRAAILVDSTKYDYVDVQFVIAKGDGYFFLHGLKGGLWHNSGTSYVVDPGWIRLGDGKNTSSDRVIEVFDAAGNKVTSLMKNNVLYTLRVYIKVGELDEIRISKNGSTIYFANVKQGVASDLEPTVVEGPRYSTDGNHEGELATVYAGDVTALGFTEGTTVYEQVVGDGWNDRVAIVVDANFDYVDIQFAYTQDTTLCIWVNDLGGAMLTGNYSMSMSGALSVASGALDRKMQILDGDGNVVTTTMETGKVYTLRIYVEGLSRVQLSTFSGARNIYYGNISFGDDK